MIVLSCLSPTAHGHTLLQVYLLRPGKMKKPEGYGAGTVTDAANQAAAAPEQYLDKLDRPLAQGGITRPERAYRDKPCAVDITTGQVKQQVLYLADAQVLQAFANARTHTFQYANGITESRWLISIKFIHR